MTIVLQDDFRTPLIQKLTDILSRVKIQSNFFLDYNPFRELADLEKKLEKKESGKLSRDFVSDSPLTDFIFESLSEELQRTRQYDSNTEPYPLSQIQEYNEPASLADRVVKNFESLPREYKLFIELPVYELKEVLKAERVELSDSLSLIYPSQEFQSSFSPPIYEPRNRPIFFNFASSVRESEPTLSWDDWKVYCEISLQGFIGIYEDTYPIKRANFLVRSFCGLSLVLRLFDIGYISFVKDAYLKVYENTVNKWEAKKTRLLSTELVHGLQKLNLHKSLIDESGIIKPGATPRINILKRLFSNEQENERLLRAAQWYFDSYCGDNELLSFVKATICIEMLLGEKKLSQKTGVMELLRTRCAYLIGQSHKDREQIEKDFTEIYNTRSNIVHNGQDKLTKLERDRLFDLRWLCARVIRKEIEITYGN